MVEKERLDIILVKRNLVSSRDLAKSIIMSGNVYVKGIKEDKAGTKIDINSDIEIKGCEMKYVSRGGYKLEKAIKEFNIDINNKICIDIGASTGGFTDCMLQNGANKVYSIDVGYGQLAWKLRNNERVICLEKTNIRYITNEKVPDKPNFASIDVSFISLTKVIPAVLSILDKNAEIVCLIKPQFEAGREKVGKKGVVRDINVHKEVIFNIIDFIFKNNLVILNIGFSPIKGPEGNIEYLIYVSKSFNIIGFSKEEAYYNAVNVVNMSHNILN